MSIIKVNSKKAKKGYTYKVTFKYKENGLTRTYSKSGFVTKKEAKEHETTVKADIKKHGYIKKPCELTLNEVYSEFLTYECDNYQPNTIHNTMTCYEGKIRNVLGNKKIVELDYSVLQRYFNSLKNQGIENNKNIKKTLNRILRHAMKMQYIQANPLSMVEVRGIEKKKNSDDIISDSDFYDLVESLKSENTFISCSYAIALEIGFYTGLRLSEVFALEKNDIDLVNDQINVNKKIVYLGIKKDELYITHQMKSKNSKSIIPLVDPLKQSLKKWFKINPYEKIICDSDGNYLHPVTSSTQIKKAAQQIGIDFHFHMLRHTFVTNLFKNNVDIKTVQELARHSNIETTIGVYTHIREDEKIIAMNNVFESIYSKNTPKIN